MILTFLINFASVAINGMANLLPVGGLPTWIGSALVAVASGLNAWSYLFPVNTILTVLTFVVLYETLVWGWHGVLWLWKKLPFIGK